MLFELVREQHLGSGVSDVGEELGWATARVEVSWVAQVAHAALFRETQRVRHEAPSDRPRES